MRVLSVLRHWVTKHGQVVLQLIPPPPKQKKKKKKKEKKKKLKR